jgi:hypothetical protein
MIYAIDCVIPLANGLGVRASLPVDPATIAQESVDSADHDDPDGIIDSVTFSDTTQDNELIRCLEITVKDTAQTNQEAVVRWKWNNTTYEIKVVYIGP